MPAATLANTLAWALPTMRTVEVQQFCSWSACRMNSWFSTLTTSSSISYGSAGTENIMLRKLAQ